MGRTALAVAAFWALAACATSPRAGENSRNEDLIASDEIVGTTATDAYELVQRHRPRWLRGRGPASFRDPTPALPVIYVDGVRVGGVETLRNIPVLDLEYLRHFGAAEATTRYGTGHIGGVIAIATRKP
ncbi:MAG: hypothetical protein HY704_00600 [Gemmatimonadetes bacterium]|nr:hypothetical protein [Gemmatimonadota bacterium]